MITGVVYAEESSNGLVTKTTNVLAAKFIRQVNLLNNIKLDDGIFEDPAFRSLVDWSRPIPDEPAGRNNPFAPL